MLDFIFATYAGYWSHNLDYRYMTIDQWREFVRQKGAIGVEKLMKSLDGFACIAGAVVPGKYLRGTPISINEMKDVVEICQAKFPPYWAAGLFADGVSKVGIRYVRICF